MDCDTMGDIMICGNFAERQETEPENFDFMSTAKWYQDYPCEWRETLGGVVCSCKRVKVDYAPYYGFDYFHLDNCNLMRKLAAEPGIHNLIETYLPAMTHYNDSVPNTAHIPIYIKGPKRGRAYKVKVRLGAHIPPQLVLL